MSLLPGTKEYLRANCPCDLRGKRVLITGANGGIGYKSAETLLFLGADLIMACRNPAKAAAARDALLRDYPGARIDIMTLDVADLASIDAFAGALPDVDVFINNAGLYHRPGEKTKDGFDLVMGTNYVGAYYVTESILGKLLACGHDVALINTVSIVHKIARTDYSRFGDSRGAYSRSKLCLARYSYALTERCEGTNVHVYMSHPGIAITDIAKHMFGPLYALARIMPFNSAEKSALAAAWILSHRPAEGSVVGPGGFLCAWGLPAVNKPCPRALQGQDELLEFTKNEIEKVKGHGSERI